MSQEQGMLALARVLPHVRPMRFSRRRHFWLAVQGRMRERLQLNAAWPEAIGLITADDVEGAFGEVAIPIREALARAGFSRVEFENTAWEVYQTAGPDPFELVLPLPKRGNHEALFREYEWKAREFLLAWARQLSAAPAREGGGA